MKIKFISFIILILSYNILNAQADLTGIWNGTLKVAGDIHLVLHIAKTQTGLYEGMLDSPDQNVSGIKCDKVEINTSTQDTVTLSFTITKIKLSYTGKLVNDSTLSGMFTQGITIPLDFHRTGVAYTAKNIVRP